MKVHSESLRGVCFISLLISSAGDITKYFVDVYRCKKHTWPFVRISRKCVVLTSRMLQITARTSRSFSKLKQFTYALRHVIVLRDVIWIVIKHTARLSGNLTIATLAFPLSCSITSLVCPDDNGHPCSERKCSSCVSHRLPSRFSNSHFVIKPVTNGHRRDPGPIPETFVVDLWVIRRPIRITSWGVCLLNISFVQFLMTLTCHIVYNFETVWNKHCQL